MFVSFRRSISPIKWGDSMNECPYMKESSEKKEKRETTTSKRVVWFILLNGVAWIWCSYLLAYLQRVEIAEELSKVALTSIVATVLGYYLKSLFENISKNNMWPDKNGGTLDLGSSSVSSPTNTIGQDCDDIL